MQFYLKFVLPLVCKVTCVEKLVALQSRFCTCVAGRVTWGGSLREAVLGVYVLFPFLRNIATRYLVSNEIPMGTRRDKLVPRGFALSALGKE